VSRVDISLEAVQKAGFKDYETLIERGINCMEEAIEEYIDSRRKENERGPVPDVVQQYMMDRITILRRETKPLRPKIDK